MSTEPASLPRTLQPLPRPPRSRRRDKLDRGLPADNEIQRLATEYLNCQRKAWPELVKAGLLPEPTPNIINTMVDDFKSRHRTGAVDLSVIQAFKDLKLLLGANYNRFSCDNSSPNSILDQMVKSLLKARTDLLPEM